MITLLLALGLGIIGSVSSTLISSSISKARQNHSISQIEEPELIDEAPIKKEIEKTKNNEPVQNNIDICLTLLKNYLAELQKDITVNPFYQKRIDSVTSTIKLLEKRNSKAFRIADELLSKNTNNVQVFASYKQAEHVEPSTIFTDSYIKQMIKRGDYPELFVASTTPLSKNFVDAIDSLEIKHLPDTSVTRDILAAMAYSYNPTQQNELFEKKYKGLADYIQYQGPQILDTFDLSIILKNDKEIAELLSKSNNNSEKSKINKDDILDPFVDEAEEIKIETAEGQPFDLRSLLDNYLDSLYRHKNPSYIIDQIADSLLRTLSLLNIDDPENKNIERDVLKYTDGLQNQEKIFEAFRWLNGIELSKIVHAFSNENYFSNKKIYDLFFESMDFETLKLSLEDKKFFYEFATSFIIQKDLTVDTQTALMRDIYGALAYKIDPDQHDRICEEKYDAYYEKFCEVARKYIKQIEKEAKIEPLLYINIDSKDYLVNLLKNFLITSEERKDGHHGLYANRVKSFANSIKFLESLDNSRLIDELLKKFNTLEPHDYLKLCNEVKEHLGKKSSPEDKEKYFKSIGLPYAKGMDVLWHNILSFAVYTSSSGTYVEHEKFLKRQRRDPELFKKIKEGDIEGILEKKKKETNAQKSVKTSDKETQDFDLRISIECENNEELLNIIEKLQALMQKKEIAITIIDNSQQTNNTKRKK